MAILSDFFLGDERTAAAYSGASDLPEGTRFQTRRLTELEMGRVLLELRGGGDPVSLMREFEMAPSEDFATCLGHFPDDMTASLAQLNDDQVEQLAARLVIATQAELSWETKDFVELISALRGLAKQVDDSRRIYFWNCI